MARAWHGTWSREGEDPFAWLKSDVIIQDFRRLKQRILDEWRRLAAANIKNPTMLARFQKSMRVVKTREDHTGMLVELALDTMWGRALEFGWAPFGTSFEDGIGRYDGGYHDLRPFMLTGTPGGEPGEKGPNGLRRAEDGHLYRYVRISHSLSTTVPSHGNMSPLQYLINKVAEAQAPRPQASRKAKFYRTHTEDAPDPTTVAHLQKRAGEVLTRAAKRDPRGTEINVPSALLGPTSKRRPGFDGPGKSTIDYAVPILKRMMTTPASERGMGPHFGKTATGLGGNVGSTVRTISDNNRDMSSWFTPGIAPANTLEKVGALAHELVREFFEPR